MPRECAVCTEKERSIELLQEQVRWLRTVAAGMADAPPAASSELSLVPPSLHVSEEEEDLRWMQAQGYLTADQVAEKLEQIGVQNIAIS